jgi:hypothetical protein
VVCALAIAVCSIIIPVNNILFMHQNMIITGTK